MILKDIYNFIVNKCLTFVKDAYIFAINKYSNVANSTYNFVNQLFNPNIVKKTPPEKDLITLSYIEDKSSGQNKRVAQLDIRLKDGRYVRTKHHSQNNSYGALINRLENGKGLDNNFDKIIVDVNGQLLSATFGNKGVSQLDVSLFQELLAGKTRSTPGGTSFEVTSTSKARGDGNCGFRAIIVGKTGLTPGGPKFEVTRVSQVSSDGNCGFRAIIGGKALSSPDFNREKAISLIIHNLYNDNGVTKNLINNDIKALYQEWTIDQEMVIPETLKKHFQIAYRESNNLDSSDPDQRGYEKNLEKIQTALLQKEMIQECYLNQYLINKNNYPHAQGSLIAFAKAAGKKLYCWQDIGAKNLRLVDDLDNQNWDHQNGEAHLLYNGINHFDSLNVSKIQEIKVGNPSGMHHRTRTYVEREDQNKVTQGIHK